MSHAIARTTAAPRAPLQQRRHQRGGTVQGRISASAAVPTTSDRRRRRDNLRHTHHSLIPVIGGNNSNNNRNNVGASGRGALTVTKYGERIMEYCADGMGCVVHDPHLAEYEAHLKYRWKVFNETKDAIIESEGSMDNFSKGYLKFGFNKDAEGNIVYREWAPAAQAAALIGDFNEWNQEANIMTKDEYGVFECVLPPGAIPHNTRVKIRLHLYGEENGPVDRIPAWIKRSVQEPGVMGAHYDGVYWAGGPIP